MGTSTHKAWDCPWQKGEGSVRQWEEGTGTQDWSSPLKSDVSTERGVPGSPVYPGKKQLMEKKTPNLWLAKAPLQGVPEGKAVSLWLWVWSVLCGVAPAKVQVWAEENCF